jgi:CrcB protein
MRDVLAVSAGGALGALARYGLQLAWPVPAAGFPWSTLVINATGCLLIGVLMERVDGPLRPFLGAGVLGGFTTFSAYAVEISGLPWSVGVPYLLATLLVALPAVFLGARLGRRA